MPIVKSNKLIETSYKLNSREQFFVLYLISKISQQDQGFREYTMHYSEIERIINFDGKRRIANKSEVFSLMDKLNSETIMYEKGNIIGKSVWLQHMEHNTDTDEFTFSLSEKLRDYLVQLKEHFTRYNISNIVYLNSSAIRLYEVLKRHQFKGECEITVDKIKFYLGIENRYSKFYEFKRWVLIPSQKEIQKYTDIKFEYKPAKKEGKKIISLKFFIYENEPDFKPGTIQLLSKIDPKVGEEFQNKRGAALFPTKNEEGLNASLSTALDFLASKGINKVFIKENIFTHHKINYEPLKGYEDIYFKVLWKFFSDKTNSDKPAGAFVTWWKKGTLTEDGLHARMIEYVINRKKTMTEKERNHREGSRMDFGVKENITISEIDLKKAFAKSNFDIESFKADYPDTYQKILKRIKNDYEDTFKSLNQEFDPEKYRKAIEDKVYHHCQDWYTSMRQPQK
ncbi:MAG: hypothetical protein ACI8P3_004289 [Saprospiraceae bacterium]|jgi:plasmid replication initiation protein